MNQADRARFEAKLEQFAQALAGKADAAAIIAALGTKADAVATAQALAGKAAQTALDFLIARVDALSILGPYTVAQLPAPSVDNLGRLAIVTDLFGNRYGRVRCERIKPATGADFYFWQPLSSDSFGEIAVAAGSNLVRPLMSPQTTRVTGAITAGVTRTISLDVAGGWPGCIKEFTNATSMGALSILNIAGTGLGSGVGLALGGYRKFGLDYVGGALTWVQLV